MKSLRDSDIANTVAPEGASDYTAFAVLHQLAWGRKDLRTIFHDRVVQRDSQQGPPQTVKVLSWAQDSLYRNTLLRPFNVSSILVRKEYVSLLLDILRDVLDDPPSQVTSGDDNMDVESDIGLKGELFDYISRTVDPGAAYAVVIGTPGIGKSMFLFFVIALRILAGLPTILQMHDDRLCIITHEGAFELDYPVGNKSLPDYLPDGTWVLVDSGDVPTVPNELVALCVNVQGYLIQAASPRSERIEWSKKAIRRPTLYWMALWTLEELIQARDLQVWSRLLKRPSEQALSDFCRLFGRSARSVYGNAANRFNYETGVLGELATVTREKLRTMLHNLRGLVFDKEVFHSIVMAEPDPSDRRRLTMMIASDYLTDQILDRIRESDRQAASHLYWLFITNPHTRSHAGYLLERLVRESFPNGGQWQMAVMEQSDAGAKNTHWHLRPNAPRRFLCLGGGQHCLTVADRPQDGQILPVPHYSYPTNMQITLVDGFYSPISGTQPTFDAFAYDAARSWATIFQMTVSPSHAISTLGLDRLTALGARTIDLVVITDPKEAMDVYVANTHRNSIRHVYHIVLQGEVW